MNIAESTIETARLRLRLTRREDWDDCIAIWSNPAVTAHILATPSTATETWLRMLRHNGLWTIFGYGYWVVEDLASGRVVGETGFSHYHRGLDDYPDTEPEMGWVLHPEYHGRGIAEEAARAAIDWLTRNTDHESVAAMIKKPNKPSFRLAEKLGFGFIKASARDEGITQVLRLKLSRSPNPTAGSRY